MNEKPRNIKRPIQVDLDKSRIREIVSEAYRMISEYGKGEIHIEKDLLMEKLEVILGCGKISTRFYLNVPSDWIPDLQLRVDPVRKKVLARSKLKKRAAKLNHFLKVL